MSGTCVCVPCVCKVRIRVCSDSNVGIICRGVCWGFRGVVRPYVKMCTLVNRGTRIGVLPDLVSSLTLVYPCYLHWSYYISVR